MPLTKTAALRVLVVLAALSAALNLGLLRRVLKVSQRLSSSGRHNTDYPYTPAEIPGYIPPVALTFESPDTHYSLEDDTAWASTIAPQSGFLRLGAKGDPVGTALNHQLHCVNGIRFSYVATRGGLFHTEAQKTAAFAHVNHCFDLLRQSILCKADSTLIPLGGNGTVTRRCRDWATVRKFIDENHGIWDGLPYDYTPPASTSSSANLGAIVRLPYLHLH
ncbi:hypothetical protein GGX14DRAFT_577611 [Mycena pura]|uniref:Oxidase ustYa n=1 Tax=Mycena pura TaxID=153505 RepID=A0AAD6URK0_9AGAR|nr:hypothetical protein GGX14DRAFT_577611 [Mycena pura]